jgi:purine-binding chemotaxis protein CheW
MTLPSAPLAGAAPSTAAPPSIQEFLAFKLGHEEYGIDILRVQEIRSYEKPTRIANAPDFIKGVVNLRGVIVPIIDLRLKLNLEQAHYDHLTVVIVLNIGQRVMGIVVDAVSDVVTLAPEQLRPVPKLGAGMASEHLLAIGAVDDRMLILVDIEGFMSGAEIGLVEPTLQ